MIAMAGRELEKIQKEYLPERWPSLHVEPIPSPVPLLTKRALKVDGRDEAEPKPGMLAPEFWRRRSDPFSVYTLQHRSFIRHVVDQLCTGAEDLSPWPALFLALNVVDGVAWTLRLREFWQSITQKTLWRLGVTPVVVWNEPDGNAWCQPLQPLSKTECKLQGLYE
jgi:hypothetical protein